MQLISDLYKIILMCNINNLLLIILKNVFNLSLRKILY
jgi:hypothetical protein